MQWKLTPEVICLNNARARSLTALLVFLILVLGTVGCGRQEKRTDGRLLVAASIAPMYNFSREVGGDLVRVELLVPPGASPHVYQLTPDQMEVISDAKVLVLNGGGLEFWADKAVDAADNPDLLVIKTAGGLKLVDETDEHEGHGGGNPHVWLDPIDAIHQVEAIRDAFIKADPKHKQQYTQNTDEYIKKLRALDRDIREQVSTFSSKRFVAFHAAWIYFAQRYGLDQAAVIEESPGKEPSAQHIRSIVDTVRTSKVRAVIAEPQLSPKAAQVIAEETRAKVVTLDPMGQPPDYSYIDMMRKNVARLAKVMK